MSYGRVIVFLREKQKKACSIDLHCLLSRFEAGFIPNMSYHEWDDVAHMAPLPCLRTTEQDTSSSDDSEVEVTSLFDPDEHELIQLSTYLHVHSDDDDTDEDREEEKNSNEVLQHLVSYSNSDDSTDEFDLIQTRISPSTSNASQSFDLCFQRLQPN